MHLERSCWELVVVCAAGVLLCYRGPVERLLEDWTLPRARGHRCMVKSPLRQQVRVTVFDEQVRWHRRLHSLNPHGLAG